MQRTTITIPSDLLEELMHVVHIGKERDSPTVGIKPEKEIASGNAVEKGRGTTMERGLKMGM